MTTTANLAPNERPKRMNIGSSTPVSRDIAKLSMKKLMKQYDDNDKKNKKKNKDFKIFVAVKDLNN